MVPRLSLLQTILLLLAFFASLTSANTNTNTNRRNNNNNNRNKAQKARWLVGSSLWGTLSWMKHDPSSPSSPPSLSNRITSMAQSNGRIFYYLPSFHNNETDGFSTEGSLTLSEAALNSTQFEGARCGVDGTLDPEDPRCAKLTVSGTIQPCYNDDYTLGRNTLFRAHPQMANWPLDHNFIVYEHRLTQVWMIDDYGGGVFVPPEEYYRADLSRLEYLIRTETKKNNHNDQSKIRQRPDFTHNPIGHARWLVFQSLWTTVTTVSSRHTNHTFGNIRSVVDGECLCSSSGKPSFYLPNPDPTTKDILQNRNVVLSFTEAVLPELVDGDSGVVCDGVDPEDPTCAKLSMVGRAVELEGKEVTEAQAGFKARHPRAKWLSDGSAHTGGKYYTIEISSLEFFRSYGGRTEVDVEEYEGWVVPDTDVFWGGTVCGSLVDTDVVVGGASDMEHGSWEKGSVGTHNGGKSQKNHEQGDIQESKRHDYGNNLEWERHEHGEGHIKHGGHEGVTHHHHKTSPKNNPKLKLSTVAFQTDTAFGLLLWGILIVLILYRMSCGNVDKSGYESASKGDIVQC